MTKSATILLFVGDRPVLSSLQFSLTIEGLRAVDGAVWGSEPCAAAALVIDQRYRGDGLSALGAPRAKGCQSPAILLATNPSESLRACAAGAGAAVVEKPLLDEELSSAIRAAIATQKTA